MTLTSGPNVGLFVNGAQGEAHYSELMRLLRGIDLFSMPRVSGYLTNTPPGSPTDGLAHILGASPTGVWAGHAAQVARYSTVAAAWEFYTPANGWAMQSNSAREAYLYTSGAWELFYQEGTFTPTLSGATTAGTQTYGARLGRYTRIGRTIVIDVDLELTAKGGTMAGMVIITGLPFALSQSLIQKLFVAVQNLSLVGKTVICGWTATGSTTQILLQDGNSSTAVDAADVTATTKVWFSADLTLA
jgi:hypothetical protein